MNFQKVTEGVCVRKTIMDLNNFSYQKKKKTPHTKNFKLLSMYSLMCPLDFKVPLECVLLGSIVVHDLQKTLWGS